MDKEAILEKSRMENKGRDERDREALATAGQRAYAVGGLVCMAIVLINRIFGQDSSPATWAAWTVYFAMAAVLFLVKYQKLKKTHELIFGVLFTIFGILFLVLYIYNLAK